MSMIETKQKHAMPSLSYLSPFTWGASVSCLRHEKKSRAKFAFLQRTHKVELDYSNSFGDQSILIETSSCNLQFFFRTNYYSTERFSHGVTASCLYFANSSAWRIKGTSSSWSEQTFDRAWNWCLSFRWTQWLEKHIPQAYAGLDNRAW